MLHVLQCHPTVTVVERHIAIGLNSCVPVHPGWKPLLCLWNTLNIELCVCLQTDWLGWQLLRTEAVHLPTSRVCLPTSDSLAILYPLGDWCKMPPWCCLASMFTFMAFSRHCYPEQLTFISCNWAVEGLAQGPRSGSTGIWVHNLPIRSLISYSVNYYCTTLLKLHHYTYTFHFEM